MAVYKGKNSIRPVTLLAFTTKSNHNRKIEASLIGG